MRSISTTTPQRRSLRKPSGAMLTRLRDELENPSRDRVLDPRMRRRRAPTNVHPERAQRVEGPPTYVRRSFALREGFPAYVRRSFVLRESKPRVASSARPRRPMSAHAAKVSAIRGRSKSGPVFRAYKQQGADHDRNRGTAISRDASLRDQTRVRRSGDESDEGISLPHGPHACGSSRI